MPSFMQDLHSSGPRLLPKVALRKQSLGQQRINCHRSQPRGAFHCRPPLQLTGRCFALEFADGTFLQDLQERRITAIDEVEIPRASNHLLIGFASTWPGLQQEQGFHVDLSIKQNLALLIERIWRNPHAVLKPSKAFLAQVATQSCALGIPRRWHVKQNEPPSSVPFPRPARLWIAAAQRMQPPLPAQSVKPVVSRHWLSLDESCLFQFCRLTPQTVSIGPTLIRFRDIDESGARQLLG